MSSDDIQNSRRAILEQVKRIVLHHLSGRSANAYLFGSWARSQEKQSSDIDVAVEFDTNDNSNHRTLMSIRHALEESTIPYKVDVVHLNQADDDIISKVKKEGVLWDDPVSE
jgi:predicted nucleotidyltransferase